MLGLSLVGRLLRKPLVGLAGLSLVYFYLALSHCSADTEVLPGDTNSLPLHFIGSKQWV